MHDLLQAKAGSGDITATSLDVSGTANFTTNSGDIRLPDLSISSGKMQINSKYGDINLKINEKCLSRLSITMKTADGDISVAKSLDGQKSVTWNTAGSMCGMHPPIAPSWQYLRIQAIFLYNKGCRPFQRNHMLPFSIITPWPA